jgi:hypothetical protein
MSPQARWPLITTSVSGILPETWQAFKKQAESQGFTYRDAMETAIRERTWIEAECDSLGGNGKMVEEEQLLARISSYPSHLNRYKALSLSILGHSVIPTSLRACLTISPPSAPKSSCIDHWSLLVRQNDFSMPAMPCN